MDSRKIIIYVAIIFIFSSCGNLNNPEERNILSFKSDIDSVANKIGVMNNILEKTDKKYFIFGVDEENILFVDDLTHNIKDVGFISDTLLYRSNLLNFIEMNQRKLFVRCAEFLNTNFLTRCNEENGSYLYLYRANIYMADRQKDLMRYVVLAKDIRDLNLNKYKVLDNKGDLYLLADKDAEIWEN